MSEPSGPLLTHFYKKGKKYFCLGQPDLVIGNPAHGRGLELNDL